MGILGGPLGWIMYGIDLVIRNYGWSLVIFILLTKVAMWPLSVKQQKSTARMAAFQPKLKQLEKQYGKDKQRYQQEMMSLYEKEGINPAGGCLPLVVQMVLLFGIIDVIYKPLKHLIRIPSDMLQKALAIVPPSSAQEIDIISKIQAGSAEFNNIFTADIIDKIQNFDMDFLGLNLGVVPQSDFWSIYLLIPILSFATAFLTTIISMKIQEKNGQSMQGPMKYMMYFMPLMSLWIAFGLPAGVGFYWTISNVFSAGQSILLAKLYSPDKLKVKVENDREKVKAKREKRRLKMEQYDKILIERGEKPKFEAQLAAMRRADQAEEERLNPPAKPASNKAKKAIDKESYSKDKELAKNRIAEARKKMAEKYGDTYTED